MSLLCQHLLAMSVSLAAKTELWRPLKGTSSRHHDWCRAMWPAAGKAGGAQRDHPAPEVRPCSAEQAILSCLVPSDCVLPPPSDQLLKCSGLVHSEAASWDKRKSVRGSSTKWWRMLL